MASSSSSYFKSKRTTKVEAPESNDYAMNTEANSSAGDTVSGKRLKKDDSGINVIPESDASDGSSDIGDNNHLNQWNESAKFDESERDSADSGNLESSSLTEFGQGDSVTSMEPAAFTECPSVGGEPSVLPESEANAEPVDQYANELSRMRVESEIPVEEDSDEEFERVKPKKVEKKNYDPTPNTPKPKHNWIASKVLTSRQYGFSSKYSPDLFRYNCYGSLHMVERLELMYKMKKHDGCVNALNFNTTGTRLVSGSDDWHVIVWDWIVSEPILQYRSGHETNVFQAKYMPLSNDCFIVTCARDGQVRLGELSSDGGCKSTRKIAQHKGSAHRLSVQMDSPHHLLTCGEDAAVFSIDLREDKPNKLVTCKSKEKKIPLYTIFINPQKSHEFAVAGRSQYVKIYDSRFVGHSDPVLKDFCPGHLVSDEKLNVTSLVYNYNGQEIIASYNDEDIYMFDTQENDSRNYLHRYRGHRNNQTVKGVNYFGSKSEYIMSGSDCGCIFFWEKQSEHIVKYMYGDEGGVVNCLEPNPTMPVLATSGLDDDIKIWVPSCEDPPDLSGLKKHLIKNMEGREQDNRDYPDAFVDQTIWFLMQHLSGASRRSEGGANDGSDSSTASSDEMDGSSVSAPQCSQS